MKIVILGAGYAGVTAALRLARISSRKADVTLVSRDARFVERIRLHEHAAGRRPKARPIASLLRGSRASFVVGDVAAVDTAARTVTLDDGRSLAWDRLVLALGSRPDMTAPGAEEHALALDCRCAAELVGRLPELARRRGRVVVVGGGLTGVEAAAELAEAWPDLRVTLLTRGAASAGFSRAAREHMVRSLERLGVEVVTNVSVRELERDRVVTTDGSVAFDACVWAVGFVASPLPAGLSLAQSARGQVLVDAFLSSVSDPNVYVAGDLAVHARPPAIAVPMGCKSAGPSGAHVADNLLREIASRPRVAFDYAAPGYCVSLGRSDGVIQLTRADGALEGAVVRGRVAAWIKEMICKSTIAMLRLERYGLSSYAAFRAGNVAPALEAPRAAPPGALGS